MIILNYAFFVASADVSEHSKHLLRYYILNILFECYITALQSF